MRKIYLHIVTLALLMSFFLTSGSVAQAEKEEWTDLPTKTTINGYTVEYIPSQNTNLTAGSNISFTFRVTDSTGKPADKLDLKFVAVRDYSGQVKKEHNGPRDPLVGPIKLIAGQQPGEYITANSATFSNNGHWRLYVDGDIFGKERAKFTQAIAINPTVDAGVRLDWILWPVLVITVLSIVFFIGNKGIHFEVPAAEMANANERRG